MFEPLNWLIGWFGLGMLATALSGAAAVFITAFVPASLGSWLRNLLIGCAVASALATTIYGKGRYDEKIEWDAAVAAQIKVDNTARADAERDAARGVSDHYDRDQQTSGVRPMARDLILPKAGHPGNRQSGPHPQSHR